MLGRIEDWFLEIWTNLWATVWPDSKNFAPTYMLGRTIIRVIIYGSIGIVVFSFLGVKNKIDKLFVWAQR
jgi:hypothetical protein